MSNSHKIIVSVTNDLTTDQRVHKVCTSLQNKGYEVKLVGRLLPHSMTLDRSYPCKRFKLWFNKGFLFYANYNIRLLIYLLFSKADILLANDLDTLPANHLASKMKKLHLVYDSHELFTEVPELIHRPRKQEIWKNLEQIILPKLQYAYTVSPLIVEEYNVTYGADFKLIRNFPLLEAEEVKQPTEKDKIIIYQGALNIGRGLEELILAMKFVEDAKLWLVGGGDIENELKSIVEENDLKQKVQFLGRLPFHELKRITQQASLGVSLEKKEGLNYAYALPNKVFDYIHAGVPVLYADLEAVKRTLDGFSVGEVLQSHEAKELGEQLTQMLVSNQYSYWQQECMRAKQVFNWEKEEETLFAIFDALEQD